MDLISIIIPVRNCAEYLEACMSSVMKQTYRNLEIIAVNDGSTDGSEEILGQMSLKDDRITVLRGPERGLGAARQMGFDHAGGVFTVFVDADDFLWGEDCLRRLHDAMRADKADIAVGNYVRLMICGTSDEGQELVPAMRHGWNEGTDIRRGGFRFEGFFSKGHLAYAWGKMYRSSFLREKGITFSSLSYAEDKLFNFMCYGNGARYVFLEEDIYCYRQNPGSLSGIYREDFKENWLKLAGMWQEALQRNGWDRAWEDLTAFILIFAVFFDGKMKYEQDGGWNRLLSLIKEYKKEPAVKEYIGRMVRGDFVAGIDSLFWKWGLWVFALCVRTAPAWVTASGVRLLVDCRIDKRLSSTGKGKKRKV